MVRQEYVFSDIFMEMVTFDGKCIELSFDMYTAMVCSIWLGGNEVRVILLNHGSRPQFFKWPHLKNQLPQHAHLGIVEQPCR